MRLSCAMRRRELVPTIAPSFRSRSLPPMMASLRIGALRNRGDGEAFGQFGREILHAVDGEIDAAVEQGFFDFFGEEAFAADLAAAGTSVILSPVVLMTSIRHSTPRAFQTFLDVVRLPERKLRAPGPDHQHKPSVTIHDCHEFRPGGLVEHRGA